MLDRLHIPAYNYVSYWYDKKQIIDLILFDFSKAFDVVHHRTLLKKLYEIGIRGRLLEWIKSFLCGRAMQVKVDGAASGSKDVLSGVPQGSVLGPLLFIIFINHITADLNSKYMIFADDLKLYLKFSQPANTANAIAELQRDIDKLYQTATSWGLVFCSEKCVNIRFKRPKQDCTTTHSTHWEICQSKWSIRIGTLELLLTLS